MTRSQMAFIRGVRGRVVIIRVPSAWNTGLGLDHYEGRTWTGWNRHVTLVAAAHLFLTTLRLTSPKATGAA